MLHLSYLSPLCDSPLCGGINLIQRSFDQILEMIEQRVIDRNPEEVPLTGTSHISLVEFLRLKDFCLWTTIDLLSDATKEKLRLIIDATMQRCNLRKIF